MELLRFSTFGLQSLLEAKISYLSKFQRILRSMSSPIAIELLKSVGTEVDIQTNYIDTSDENDTISFIQDSRVKSDIDFFYTVLSPGNGIHTRGPQIDKIANLLDATTFSSTYPPREEGEIQKTIMAAELKEKEPSCSNYVAEGDRQYDRIHKFLSKNGEIYLLYPSAIKKTDTPKARPQILKVGRWCLKMAQSLGIKFSDKQIEEFVNEYKSKVEILGGKFGMFEIVDGEEIRYWYSDTKYETGGGTLQNSCMRYSKCQSYLDIYVKNNNMCKMLILNSHQEDKIAGRALIWTLSDGSTFMDRIYTTKDSDQELFKEYARKEGWYYKYKQNSRSDEAIMKNDGTKRGDVRDGDIEVNLDYSEFDNYPYMDTLKFLSHGSSSISTYRKSKHDGFLESTDGGDGRTCATCGDDQEVECSRCEGEGNIDCEECSNGRVECSRCDSGDVDCTSCDGEGSVDGETCETCDGNGTTPCDRCEQGYVDCRYCGGEGRQECGNCEGNGTLECPDCS